MKSSIIAGWMVALTLMLLTFAKGQAVQAKAVARRYRSQAQ